MQSEPPTKDSQRLKPLRDKPAGALLVHEIYRSIQGESTFAGLPCVFLRLTGCHLRCRWCDTPQAFTRGQVLGFEEVLAHVLDYRTELVQITGGEPLLQPEVLPLMSRLADAGRTVLLETSGTVDIAPVDRRVHVIMDLKCPGSGECHENRFQNLAALKPTDQIKFVIADRRDFEWACQQVRSRRLTERAEVLFAPAFGLVTGLRLAQWLLDSGLQVRLQLQLHKYIWGPEAQGV